MSVPVGLTVDEWQSLTRLTSIIDGVMPEAHRRKLMTLGLAAERRGRMVLTFEGKLAVRAHR
jgi:hypothetical protein